MSCRAGRASEAFASDAGRERKFLLFAVLGKTMLRSMFRRKSVPYKSLINT